MAPEEPSEHRRFTAARLLGFACGLLVAVFGGYIFYEKACLPLQTGQTEERVGLIERAFEPASFWLSVANYALCSLPIVWLGAYFMWLALRRPRQ